MMPKILSVETTTIGMFNPIPPIFYACHTKTDSDGETERITKISGLNFFVSMAHTDLSK